MASLYPKKLGGKTYWYLREMGRVDGRPKMVSERYLGTAADIAAAVGARETALLAERTRHLAFGDVAAVWGMLSSWGWPAWLMRWPCHGRPGSSACRHLSGAGGAEPAGRALLEAGLRGLAEDHRRGPVHQDPGAGAGPPPVPGRDARGHAGAPGPAGGPRAADDRAARPGHQLSGARHDQLRDLHRHRQPEGADRPARQGQAETHRPAPGRARPGGHA